MSAFFEFFSTRPPLTALCIFILAPLLSTLLLCVFTYCMTFRRRRRGIGLIEGIEDGSHGGQGKRMKEMITALDREPYELIEIRAGDGVTLRARFYNRREGAPLQIQCHGYRSHPVRDFSGGGASALRNGCNLCLIYQRAHGESEGRTISFGAKESRDLVLWINYFTERLGKDVPIVLVGISMGAATVLLTSAMELPPSVKGVIADCPYSRARDIIKLVAGRMGFPAGMVYPFIRLGGLIFGRFDIERAAPIDAIGSSRLPILLIHGEEDGFVPREMSDALYAAAKGTGRRIKYLTFPGADHGMSYIVDTDRYEGELRSFLREAVGDFINE